MKDLARNSRKDLNDNLYVQRLDETWKLYHNDILVGAYTEGALEALENHIERIIENEDSSRTK